MARAALITTAMLVCLAGPALAQRSGGWRWTADRPDGVPPAGVGGATTLPVGTARLTIRWDQRSYKDIWFRNDSLELATALQLYSVAPLVRSERRHSLEVAYGVTDRLTVRVAGEVAFLERDQLTDGGIYYRTQVFGLGDPSLDWTFNVVNEGPYRLDVNGGITVPLGAVATRDVTPLTYPEEDLLPYDMRLGSGSFGLALGASLDVQADVVSFGGQFEWTQQLNANSRDYTVGDRYEGDVWVSYTVAEPVSLSLGGRWEEWFGIDGNDPGVNPVADPHNDGFFLAGRNVIVPLGVNLLGPGASTVAGHRFLFEVAYVIRRDYEAPQLGLDWTINARYVVPM